MVIIFLSWISLSWATNHYVDKNATGGNNGTIWANAWTSFAAIQWGSVNPGDIVYISGGTDSTVYHESLDLQSSGIDGTAANLITIRNGLDAGHNGKVIIDGDNVRSPLYIRNVSYIRVVGFTIQEPLAYPRAQIEIVYPSNVIYVDSMITRDNGNGRGVGVYGIDGDYAQLDSVFLRYSRVHNDAVTPYQTDCIQVQHMTNLFLIGNYVRSDNSNQDGHSEPAYIQRINNYWIEGNKFIATNTATPHQTFHTHTLTGDLVIFNNLFWGRDQSGTKSEWTSNVYVDEDPQKNNTTERGRSYLTFYNNTVIGSRSVFTVDFQVDTIDAKNNIFYTSMPLHTINRGIVVSRREDWPPELVDYNLYYRSDAGDNIWYTGAVATYYDMADFNTLGAETGGTPSNRNLVDPLFIDDGNYDGDGCGIGVGSPCIDAGVDLPAPYNVDINGVTRLPGHFTIGAYEYADRGPAEVDPINNGLPTEFSLYQNYPNPFNPSTSIQYAVSSKQFVSLKVYDVLGNEIATLVSEEKPAGSYEIMFNAANLPSGVYFYRLQANEFVQVNKMILLK
jgi:hypothetical protein